jgi:hypothetical protein
MAPIPNLHPRPAAGAATRASKHPVKMQMSRAFRGCRIGGLLSAQTIPTVAAVASYTAPGLSITASVPRPVRARANNDEMNQIGH